MEATALTEYEYRKLPIKLIIGTEVAAKQMTAAEFAVADECWHAGLEVYRREVSGSLLYQRSMKV